MTKKRYRVLQAISYPTSAQAIKQLQAGKDVPWDERKVVERQPGEVVSDIPPMSLDWLLEQGYIVEEVTGDGSPQ